MQEILEAVSPFTTVDYIFFGVAIFGLILSALFLVTLVLYVISGGGGKSDTDRVVVKGTGKTIDSYPTWER